MTHYVARITIEKVTKEDIPNAIRGASGQPAKERIVSEIATVVTKADNLPGLVRKTMAHLEVEVSEHGTE